jgi:RNA polymerase sigma-70 factor (ECF subfamily)
MKKKALPVRMAQATALECAREDHPEALIALCAQGDERALAALYDRTSAQVNGIALRIVGDRDLAEEVTIDVYLQVWRSAQSYDPSRGSPLAWLVMLARSRAIDRLRAHSGERGQIEPLDRGLEVASSHAGPEADSAVAQRRRHVQSALMKLTADQRQAIDLAFYGGLSHSEIAEKIGAPLGTVKTRIRLGMRRLHDLLGHAGSADL